MHKGDRGHTLIAGGFTGMEGAILLSAKALFRTGCGLATSITPAESRRIIAGKVPELMTEKIPDDEPSAWVRQFMDSRRFKSLLIGPGMGRSLHASRVFASLIDASPGAGISRILIDGDGLYHLAVYLKNGSLPAGPQYCITPHFNEASVISGVAVDSLKKNRLQSCIDLAHFTGCTVVLKGPASIVSNGTDSYINTSGNSRLATAGSGDVLSGIIASFMNRPCGIETAAACGVYLHGLCADLFTAKNNFLLMKAGDIIKKIPAALDQIYGSWKTK